jgi:hypothetical protein
MRERTDDSLPDTTKFRGERDRAREESVSKAELANEARATEPRALY